MLPNVQPSRPTIHLLFVLTVLGIYAGHSQAWEGDQGSKYQVIKACSLISLAEAKKLAPWPPHLDPFAKAQEEPLGSYGSACEYPTFGIQVMQFNPGTIAAMGKDGSLESISGVGDEAWARNNRNTYAELATRVGPHLLTVQLSIDTGKTFEGTKPSLVAIGKALAARLR
jgi:hypothetical protein